jgi:hypothetical protein
VPILFLEGSPDTFIPKRVKRNVLISVKLMGIAIETVEGEQDIKIRINELRDYFNNTHHTGLIPYRYSDPKLAALMWVSGIGYKRARKLLDLYQGDLLSIYGSSKEALAKSIGETLADRFYHAIRKQPKLAKGNFCL